MASLLLRGMSSAPVGEPVALTPVAGSISSASGAGAVGGKPIAPDIYAVFDGALQGAHHSMETCQGHSGAGPV